MCTWEGVGVYRGGDGGGVQGNGWVCTGEGVVYRGMGGCVHGRGWYQISWVKDYDVTIYISKPGNGNEKGTILCKIYYVTSS